MSTPRNYREELPLNGIALLVWVAGDVAARFGRFGPNLAHADIARAAPLRYPLRVYLGWGMRGGIGGRRWAYTSAFCMDGVEFELRDGRRYYFSSRRPRELADAVEAVDGGDRAGVARPRVAAIASESKLNPEHV